MTRRLPLPAILAVFAATCGEASACAVCMGDANPNIIEATNSTLWMLIGLVAVMFVATGLTALYIWRHANAPIPPHVQLVETDFRTRGMLK